MLKHAILFGIFNLKAIGGIQAWQPIFHLKTSNIIQNVIASGLYHDRDEVLNRAVELLKRREQLIRDVNHGYRTTRTWRRHTFGYRRN